MYCKALVSKNQFGRFVPQRRICERRHALDDDNLQTANEKNSNLTCGELAKQFNASDETDFICTQTEQEGWKFTRSSNLYVVLSLYRTTPIFNGVVIKRGSGTTLPSIPIIGCHPG
ncbi:hypothetical protein NPIL_501591 [Nephila pilipes]|uniref:Uncharacterized protein n=1 Tax=Nephila pilipes TaxID=299642 RepID=A0A8X6T3G5_NEPPI|nr:hypothetical protein NPIL_501591 [Nephila pilipes]